MDGNSPLDSEGLLYKIRRQHALIEMHAGSQYGLIA